MQFKESSSFALESDRVDTIEFVGDEDAENIGEEDTENTGDINHVPVHNGNVVLRRGQVESFDDDDDDDGENEHPSFQEHQYVSHACPDDIRKRYGLEIQNKGRNEKRRKVSDPIIETQQYSDSMMNRQMKKIHFGTVNAAAKLADQEDPMRGRVCLTIDVNYVNDTLPSGGPRKKDDIFRKRPQIIVSGNLEHAPFILRSFAKGMKHYGNPEREPVADMQLLQNPKDYETFYNSIIEARKGRSRSPVLMENTLETIQGFNNRRL